MDTSLQVDYLPRHHLAVCRPTGALTAERCRYIFYFVLGLEAATPEPFDRLLDLTFVTEFPFESGAIHEYARTRRDALARVPPFRTAIIAPTFEAETVARIYSGLMEGSKISVSIFEDAKSAADWLGLPEKVVAAEQAPHT